MKLSDEDIIFEDQHLIAVNKKAGILSQRDYTNDVSILELAEEYLINKHNKPGRAFVGSIHRLDRPVSGIILIAKRSKALERMFVKFKDREIRKRYLAIIEKISAQKSGTLISYIKKGDDKNISQNYEQEVEGSKYAELSYQVIKEINGLCALEIWPKTGRTHQIRVQLSTYLGSIYGDLKYGSDIPTGNRIALHATSLHFTHPITKEPLNLHCPLPKEGIWNDLELTVKFNNINI